MNPNVRRLIITVVVLGLACCVLVVMVISPKHQPASPSAPQQRPVATPAQEPVEDSPSVPDEPPAAQTPAESLVGLHAQWVRVPDKPAQTLGSLDPREARMFLELSPVGAGLERITLSEFWLTARQSRRARAHYDALDRGDLNPPPLPDAAGRYVLGTAETMAGVDAVRSQVFEISVPLLAAYAIMINGQEVNLVSQYTDESDTGWVRWQQTDPGAFEATIVDGDEKPVARVTRRCRPGPDYDIVYEQRIFNLTAAPLTVHWIQYGPADLTVDRARYMDRRRFRFGYLPDADRFPDMIVSGNNDLLLERSDVEGRGKKAMNTTDPQRLLELLTLWPNPITIDNGFTLSWFAATNRYFALAVHPLLDVDAAGAVTGDRSLVPEVWEIRTKVLDADSKQSRIFTFLYSPPRTIAAGGETAFDLGVYAGPLDRHVLGRQQPMAALGMKGLILYQMSSMCAFCTFQWLAIGLLKFLSAVHMVTFDWGVSIILLVLVVRTLLHPLTKKAQINMQRFGKVMGDLKPEIEKLQKKYPDDPRKLQQEQMKMMRERGANPLQMLGCLPMLLQTPIWIALYAMLYFAFDLRHEPAFWGIFQNFWGWPFLGDLSAADHCFWEFQEPFRFLIWNMTGINLLPLLLGVVFFVQQKYMAPPPSPSMTPEQIQQQKIMKVMMVVMFPVMLYSAPSGLCLYICTSSFLGIIESKYVRAHIKAMDLNPPKPRNKPKKKPRDLQARAYSNALERARKKRKPPPKTFK